MRTTTTLTRISLAAAVAAASRRPTAAASSPLDLGPLNLDLLGLVVDLSPVSLDVTAGGPGPLIPRPRNHCVGGAASLQPRRRRSSPRPTTTPAPTHPEEHR
jgi:hypothetical protein